LQNLSRQIKRCNKPSQPLAVECPGPSPCPDGASSHQQSLPDPNRRTHHPKKLKVKGVMRKLKLQLKVKLNLKQKKAAATSQFPPGGQTPEKLINAKKQKKLTTNEKELTKEEVEAKNLEIRLLKPVEGFAKAAMDSDTEAEFFRAPAGDIRRLGEPQAEWMDSDDEWESGRCMLCRRRVLDDLEQLNLDLCEEDFQKRRKPEPLVPAWQWFDNETEQLDCAHDLDQAMVESRPDQEAAVRRQDEEEILRLKHLDAVERRAEEISVHKAQLQRTHQGTELTRLEFDAVDFYWDPPPPGRLMWSED